MTKTVGALDISMKDMMAGCVLHVRVRRALGFRVRVRLACWLIGLAGRVINVPCEIEMVDGDDLRVGDVVRDRFDRKMMTVDYLHGDRANCVWFDGDTLRRGTFPLRSLIKARDAGQG